MKNAVLCPLRNGLSLTRKAYKSFLAQDIPVDVMFIDNASSDGTAEWLDSVDCLRASFKKPKSVAASWNLGLKWFFNEGLPYVLVVNNDVLLRPDTYRLLVGDGGGFVTAVGNEDPACIESMAPPLAHPRPHPDFSCYLIRRWVYERVGDFDEKFLAAYCEDWDYHLRMHRAGVKAYCIDLPFYHYASGVAKQADPRELKRLHEQAERNRAYFKEKYGFAGASPEYYAEFSDSLLGDRDPCEGGVGEAQEAQGYVGEVAPGFL